jgi:hypothetical protein
VSKETRGNETKGATEGVDRDGFQGVIHFENVKNKPRREDIDTSGDGPDDESCPGLQTVTLVLMALLGDAGRLRCASGAAVR